MDLRAVVTHDVAVKVLERRGIPANLGVIVCKEVVKGAPALYVTHDADDGGWQFLCGSPHRSWRKASIECFACVIERDPTLLNLLVLEEGQEAARDGAGARWRRVR